MQGVILLGVGPKVGKTYVACLMIKLLKKLGKRPGYFSFVQMNSSSPLQSDAALVAKECNLPGDPQDMVPYVYDRDTMPHIAGRELKKLVDTVTIAHRYAWNASTCSHIVVEGTGEVVCPLVFEPDNILFQEDLIRRLKLNIILVAKVNASALSQCAMAAHYLKSSALSPAGIILNGYRESNYTHRDTKMMIERFCQTQVIGTVATRGHKLNLLSDLGELFTFNEVDDGRVEIEI